ncbi:MAG: serine protease [Ruminiclostridium sp.]|nr:serine protease [Ruminiclostridium sp.]
MSAVNNNSKLYIKILFIFIAVLLVIITVVLFVLPEVHDKQCRTRFNTELDSRIDNSVLMANICVVRYEETTEGNTTKFSYSLGASGVIYEKKQDTYYALTAYHVVSNPKEKTKFLIQSYGTPSYSQSKEGGNHLSLEEYYGQFPSAKVEYYDESCDLAVISFNISKELGILEIAEVNAEKNTEIAVISNPEGRRFVRTYGSIISNSPIIFSGNDGQSTNLAVQHNAYVAPGSSGSAVLCFENGKAEIVGINIGGGTNFMGKFQYGAMIPCRQICLFLSNWRSMGR